MPANLSTKLENLKLICFKQNVDSSLKERYLHSWALYYPLYVTHPLSIRIVWLLLKTHITPNQVTWFSFLSGWCAAVLFLFSHSVAILLAVLFFELFYILDAVDGQLARARGTKSETGAFLDEWGNFLIPPIIICCIGMTYAPPWIAFLASYAILSIPLIEILTDRAFSKTKKIAPSSQTSTPQKSKHFLKFVYSLLYRSCTMPVVMNLVTLSTLLTLIKIPLPFANFSYLGILITYYAVLGTIVWIAKGIHITLSK